MLETLRMLLNFGPDGASGMTLLLVGQPGILPLLDRTPQLEERLGVKCLLRPFTANETGQYVNHRLPIGRSATETIVAPEARAHALRVDPPASPGRSARLCDLAAPRCSSALPKSRPALTAAHFEAVCPRTGGGRCQSRHGKKNNLCESTKGWHVPEPQRRACCREFSSPSPRLRVVPPSCQSCFFALPKCLPKASSLRANCRHARRRSAARRPIAGRSPRDSRHRLCPAPCRRRPRCAIQCRFAPRDRCRCRY